MTSRTTARTAASALGWALVDEDARLDPRSSYAASKVAQEHYTSSWVRQAGAAAVALRYHNVYGPGMPRDTPYSGVAAMFRSSLERGEPPQVFEDGGQMRDFVHVDDVARANLAALRAVVGGGAGSRTPPTTSRPATRSRILDVARLVARGTGRDIAPEVTGGYRLGDVRHIVASPARAAAELGFTAEVLPEVGPARVRHGPLRDELSHLTRPCRRGAGPPARDHLQAEAPPPPPVGQQRARERQPRDERQPDPLDLGLAHAGGVGEGHHHDRRADEQQHDAVARAPQ